MSGFNFDDLLNSFNAKSDAEPEPQHEQEVEGDALDDILSQYDAPEAPAPKPVPVEAPKPKPKPIEAPMVNFDIPDQLFETTDISSAGTIATFSSGQWSNSVSDPELLDRLASMSKADPTMMKLKKALVQSKTLDRINNIINTQARNHVFKFHTMPLFDGGMRFLPGKNYIPAEQRMQEKIDMLEAAKQEFANEYPHLVEQAPSKLGDAFKAELYPPIEEILPKFYINYVPDIPLSSRGANVGAFAEEIQKRSHENYVEHLRERITGGVRERWMEGYHKILWLIDRMEPMEDGKLKRFKTPDVENALQVIDVLSSFNIFNDPDLNATADKLRKVVQSVDASKLHKDELMRENMRRDLEEAIKSLPKL